MSRLVLTKAKSAFGVLLRRNNVATCSYHSRAIDLNVNLMIEKKTNGTGLATALKPPCRRYGSIYEPEYLDAGGIQVPVYDLLNLQIKGYDFSILEKYGSYVHTTAERLGIAVDEAWAAPAKKLRVTKLKPESNVIDCEYPLNVYERIVQISEVPATLLPILINVIEAALPAGVTLRVQPHLQEHSENRYVPDLELKQLQSQLEEMKGEKK